MVILGAICLAIGGWAMWRKKLPKARIWLMLIAGLCSAGLLSRFGHYLAGLLVTVTSRLTTATIGAAAGVIVGVLVILELHHAGHPKKGKPEAWHAPLAFISPALLAAAGGIFATLAGSGTDAVANIGATISGLFG